MKYYGEHNDILDFYFGFKKRLIANDYESSVGKRNFEQFYYQVVIFEELEKRVPRDVTFHILILSAKEKLTQLIINANIVIKHVELIEQQLNNQVNREFNLTEEYFKVLNEIELYVLKLVSFLDILSKISSLFYKIKTKKAPKTYGKQKYVEKGNFKNEFDITYQKRLLKNKVINELHGYRNNFTHNVSLKLIPYEYRGKWKITISEGNKEGLKITKSIERSLKELHQFISYFEKYFYKFS